MSRFVVVFDACVLYPAPLRDFLLELALTDLFAARWTDRIHEEWITNLLDNRPDLTRAQLERTRQLMNSHARDCLVEGYEALEAALVLPDEDDLHVVAAAIKCQAQGIVTYNLKDFPASELSKYGIEAVHPDDFIASQIGLSLPTVCGAAKRCRQRLLNPPKTVEEYLQTLERQELAQSVHALRLCEELI